MDIDNATGVEEGTRLLRERGHTRIGFIGSSDFSMIDRHRREGWLRGMQGIDENLDELDLCVPEGIEHGFRAMRVLRDRGVTAASCGTDSLALGALSVLYESPVERLRPAESIVGFDDSPVAAALGFSSVVQPVEQVASLLVAQLISELEDDVETCERHVVLPSVLRARLGRGLPVRLR